MADYASRTGAAPPLQILGDDQLWGAVPPALKQTRPITVTYTLRTASVEARPRRPRQTARMTAGGKAPRRASVRVDATPVLVGAGELSPLQQLQVAGLRGGSFDGGDNEGRPLGHSSHVRFVLLQRSHTPAEAPSDSPVVAFARFVLRDDIDPANSSGAAMYLHELRVRRDCGRQGLGAWLLDLLESLARAANVRSTYVPVWPDEPMGEAEEARTFYNRMGFKPWLPTVYTEPATSSDSDSDEADVIDYTGRRMPPGAAAPGSFVRRRRH